mmetsp:Transcript_73228/g.161671  ORF Transcript_73228/g.161671 Transcript_73228/m.161671 type:complete len:386 (-) Transcript_73228:12-1169(-)
MMTPCWRSPATIAARSRTSAARLGAGSTGDQLSNLLRNLGLAHAVVLDVELLGQLLGVVSRVRHGSHARGQLRGQRLLEGAQQAAVQVQRQQRVHDLHGLLLEDEAGVQLLSLDGHLLTLHLELAALGGELEDLVLGGVHARAVGVAQLARGRQRQQRLDGGCRRDERQELGVHNLDLVALSGHERGKDRVGDARRVVHGRDLAQRELLDDIELGAALEVLLALAANGHNLHLAAQLLQLSVALLSLLQDEVVVAAAQATVTSDHHQLHRLHGAHRAQGGVNILHPEALVDAVQHLDQVLGERARVDDGVLGAADLGGSHQLHGRSNLGRVLHRGDAVTGLLHASVGHQQGAAAHGGDRARRAERRREGGLLGRESGHRVTVVRR